MKYAVKKAIEDRLSYLEDNLYRHEHFTNTPDLEVIKHHKEQIFQLKEALKEDKIK